MEATRFTTYADALAAFRAGTIGNYDLIRAERDHGLMPFARAIRRVEAMAADARRKRLAAERDAYVFSDADLAITIAVGEAAAPGPYRVAVMLQELATQEARKAVVAEAHRFQNATPDAGRYSDAVRACMNVGRKMEAAA